MFHRVVDGGALLVEARDASAAVSSRTVATEAEALRDKTRWITPAERNARRVALTAQATLRANGFDVRLEAEAAGQAWRARTVIAEWHRPGELLPLLDVRSASPRVHLRCGAGGVVYERGGAGARERSHRVGQQRQLQRREQLRRR